MNKEQYVTYETSKLLKEKGFDWGCNSWTAEYNTGIELHTDIERRNYNDDSVSLYDGLFSAPTQQMACNWLIKTHNIHIEPHFLRASGDYVYDIIHSPLKLDDIHSFPIVFNTKEDAVESALQYCLTKLI